MADNQPFQTDGLVWTNGKGMFLFGNHTLPIDEKPIFTFSFGSLYCEPTLCKKVINGKDYSLTPEEIKEIEEYIQVEKVKPQLVNGVDAHGKLMLNVERSTVFRPVKTLPPETGVWRLDPNTLFEQWVKVYPIDQDGMLLGDDVTEDSPEVKGIVHEGPPTEWKYKSIKKWKWEPINSKWIDGELYEDKIKVIQKRILEESKIERDNLSYRRIEYKVNGTTYLFDSTEQTLSMLTSAMVLDVNNLKWYPKDALDPIILSKTDIQNLVQLIFDTQQALYNNYFEDKKAIMTTFDIPALTEFKPMEKSNGKKDK
jgi:hypothetical protein